MKLNRKKKKEKILSLKPHSAHSRDGVDRSLIQWMLSLTPTQRLQILQHNIRSIMRLRGGKTSSRKDEAKGKRLEARIQD